MLYMNNRVSDHSLYEISRKNIVGKTRSQSPDRYNKRTGYKPLRYDDIDISKLLEDDILVSRIPVGKYICTIAYKGVLEEMARVLKAQTKPNLTLQTVIRALQRSIDNSDVLVDCTCGDFVYRMAYWATKYGYKYGKPETRPTKITNPDDKEGAVCKHITSVLANKRWLVKLATTLNNAIKENQDEFREAMGLSEDEMFINIPGRPSAKTNRNIKMINHKSDDSEETGDVVDGSSD